MYMQCNTNVYARQYKNIKAGGWPGGDIGRPGAVGARAMVRGLRGVWGACVPPAWSGRVCVYPKRESHSSGVAKRAGRVANERRGHALPETERWGHARPARSGALAPWRCDPCAPGRTQAPPGHPPARAQEGVTKEIELLANIQLGSHPTIPHPSGAGYYGGRCRESYPLSESLR